MPRIRKGNLFAGMPHESAEELFESLLSASGLLLERIVSTGQATPQGEWLDQDRDEWVVLLSGGAGLLFEGEAEAHVLRRGDYLLIPAHCRHRVEWTVVGSPTVWLALHFGR
jgi:cupin 2 domain-containing protein